MMFNLSQSERSLAVDMLASFKKHRPLIAQDPKAIILHDIDDLIKDIEEAIARAENTQEVVYGTK